MKLEKIDILAVTETWLTASDRDTRALANIRDTLPNFVFHHVPRSSTVGVGVGILVHRGFNMTLNQLTSVQSFEYIDISISCPCAPSHKIRFLVVYRPPYTRKNKCTPSKFFEESTSLLEGLHLSRVKTILAGDFNLHMDNANNTDSAAFMELLDLFSLHNHVDFPTHSSGHTLDLVITGRDDGIASCLQNCSYLPSDHIAVT